MRVIVKFPLKQPFHRIKSNFKYTSPNKSSRVSKINLEKENYNPNTLKYYTFSFSCQ